MSEFVRENSNIGNNSLMRSNSSMRSDSKRSDSKSKQGDSKSRRSSNSSRSKTSAMRSFTRKRARKTIGKFIKKIGDKRKADIAQVEAVKAFTRKRAQKSIGKFMKNTEDKRRSMFLQAICSDSGVCIAFGKERKKIFDFFEGFTTFTYLKNIKAIGSVSVNGFVKELEYEREGYKSYAVLKSSRQKNADNLMYEYFVGLMINNLAEQAPCFVETYGHFKYKPDRYFQSDMYREKFQNEVSGYKDLKKILIPHKPNKIEYEDSCEDSINQCILLQHIKGAKSIGDKLYSRVPDYDFIMNDFLYAIYQIYYVLGRKRHVFTHYDLHPDNVILYKPVEGKYIQFHYHLGPTMRPLSFKSQYIAKMIDYGRSFIDINKQSNSETYYKELCLEESCNYDGEQCGDESGYGWMPPPQTEDNYYISSSLNNISHDLRLLSNLWPIMPWNEEPFKSNTRIRSILKNILGRVKYENDYGTPPVVGKASLSHGLIEDVGDAEFYIRGAVQKADQKQANDDYYIGMQKLGDMHIYGNKPMEFIPA